MKCTVLKSGLCEITQGFVNGHRGLDLVGPGHTIDDIVSYENGIVQLVTNGYGNHQGEGVNENYGNFVKILNDDGTVCLYAHCEYTCVSYGQRVSKGQKIGRMGNSGNSYGAHLHWEFWRDNNYNNNIDPIPFLEPKPIFIAPKNSNRDTNKRQFKIDYNDSLRARKKPNGEILGILNAGIYDFSEIKENGGYLWVNLGNCWAACTDMSHILEIEKPKEEPKEELKEPILDDKKETILNDNDENDIIISKDDEMHKIEQKEEKIDDNINDESENIILYILKIVINLIKKIFKRI